MKLFIITACVALAAADVSHIVKSPEADAPILRQEADFGLDGQFQYAFETGNGISAQSQGQLKEVGAEVPAQVVQGEFSYTAPNGEKIQLQYVSDQNGFQPQGPHIPTPPPIPELILKSLEYNKAHPPQPDN